jgi:hypothetical protein
MDRQQDIAEKATTEHDDPAVLKETAHAAAERGHAATDMYGFIDHQHGNIFKLTFVLDMAIPWCNSTRGKSLDYD